MIRAIMPEAAAGEFEPARTVASAVGLARLVPAGGAPTEQKRTEENGEGTHRDQWSLNSSEIPRLRSNPKWVRCRCRHDCT
jgi:hypothetical protein